MECINAIYPAATLSNIGPSVAVRESAVHWNNVRACPRVLQRFNGCKPRKPSRGHGALVAVAQALPPRINGFGQPSPLSNLVLVGDWMSPDPIFVNENDSVEHILRLMVKRKIHGVPVVDDNHKLVGFISGYDLLNLHSLPGTLSEDWPAGASPPIFPAVDESWSAFQDLCEGLQRAKGEKAHEIMSPPIKVTPGDDLEHAASLLLRKKLQRLPVVDLDDHLVGILSRSDVLRAAVESLGPEMPSS
eukprot:jgi/Mesvir1/28413/Mv13855-RA.1